MNREIKVRVWDKYHRCFLMADGDYLKDVSHVFESHFTPKSEYEVTQFTGLKDRDGVDIYDGDILNICFTSGYGEHIHDGIYVAEKDALGGLAFRFIKLLWQSHGHNQFPISSQLCEKYGGLGTVYDDEKDSYVLIATTDKYTSSPAARYPFNEEKALGFCSRYFEVIGSIHETPELLEQQQ